MRQKPRRIDPLYPLLAALAGLLYPTAGVTLLVEGGLLWAFFRYDRLLFLSAAALNLLTQLALISALHVFYPRYWLALLVGEVLVVAAEAVGYALVGRFIRLQRRHGGQTPLTPKNALVLSLALNAASFTVGLLLPF